MINRVVLFEKSSLYPFWLIATSYSALNKNEYRESIYGNENQPLQPKGFPLEDLVFWPDIQDRNSHPIKAVKYHNKEDHNLEYPRFVDEVDIGGEIAPGLLHEK